MKPSVMIIEGCDFSGFPVGGQLSHAKHLIHIFGERLALVGVSTDDTPVGVWTKKKFDGAVLDYFSIGKVDPFIRKPLIPRRLSVLLRVKRYKRQIMSIGITSAFIEAPEVMIAVRDWGLRICYKFSGVENPLTMPRYPIGKLFADRFEKMLFSALANNAELILAAADVNAIKGIAARSKGILNETEILPYVTRVDTKIFRAARKAVNGPRPAFLYCGRINHVKGWELVLDAFCIARRELPSSRLYFVGDGEERGLLERKIAGAGLNDSVTITGFVDPVSVAGLMNGADVFLLGSHREGWPTVMLEAMACGLPVVSTRVSGAGDLVDECRNGYIVETRNPDEYASRMIAALKLQNPNQVSIEIARRYALDKMGDDLEALWEPFCGRW